MKVATYEAVVQDGQIKLLEPADLPEHARVYVVVTAPEEIPVARWNRPRLADPSQASLFVKQVYQEPDFTAGG